MITQSAKRARDMPDSGSPPRVGKTTVRRSPDVVQGEGNERALFTFRRLDVLDTAAADNSSTHAAAAEAVSEEVPVEDAQTCSICGDTYGDAPSIPCGHPCCSGCLDDTLRLSDGDNRYKKPGDARHDVCREKTGCEVLGRMHARVEEMRGNLRRRHIVRASMFMRLLGACRCRPLPL